MILHGHWRYLYATAPNWRDMTVDDDNGENEATKPANSVEGELSGPPGDQTHIAIPPLARMAVELQPLRNHQDFQRACVVLYSAELNDPHVQEYGRNGQGQKGIDLLGCRNGDPSHPVAIQCRRVVKPLKKPKIESDCRQALTLEPQLKEIIFATTAPDDTHATNAAREVEKDLRGEGQTVRVILYGWGQMQTRIALHESAYAVFNPSSVATIAPISASGGLPSSNDSDEIIQGVLAGLRRQGVSLPALEPDRDNWHLEDPALHARIDTYRNLFKEARQIAVARDGLEGLLPQADAATKPWARFRIETSLASIAMDLGREDEAIGRFEAAHALKPDDTHGIANLALARTMAGRFTEAMELARQALTGSPRAESGLSYLLQAAARSNWEGDPETLIPADLAGSVAADLGLADFLRRREAPGWPERVIELASRHPEIPELQSIKAMAVLALALANDAAAAGGRGLISQTDISEAADTLVGMCSRYLDTGFADDHDLGAFLNNAAVLLRLTGRQAECESLLKRGLAAVPDAPHLRRLLALSEVAQGKAGDALATLEGDREPESELLRAELLASSDPDLALDLAQKVVIDPSQPLLEYSRWRTVAEIALRAGRKDMARSAIARIAASPGRELEGELLSIKLDADGKMDAEPIAERLLVLVDKVSEDASFLFRFELADALDDADQPGLAADLLKDRVDLTRPGGPTRLYLRCLTLARRDEEYRRSLDEASDAVRDDPHLLWSEAAHYWNIGDLARAQGALERLISVAPKNGQAHLLRLEIFIRRDQTGLLLAELDNALEELEFTRLEDGLRLSRLLAHFGHLDRGAALAYKLFLSHRDVSPAWMALSAIVLNEGRTDPPRWTMPGVDLDAAVDVRFDDGEERLFFIESDPELRRIDPESVEPDHPLVQSLWGLRQGDDFETEDGRRGTVVRLRHKFVARFHYILDHHQDRFPKVSGFRRVSIDTEAEGGLEPIIALAKARQEWIEQEQRTWAATNMPLAILARRVGADVIEVAGGIAQSGQPLRVAQGKNEERRQAMQEILEAKAGGCTLELHSFWTAWRLKTLDTIVALCGPVHVPQTLLDALRSRRENFSQHCADGFKSAGYENGKLTVQEASAEQMQALRDDTKGAIEWLEANAKIRPIAAPDELPEVVREILRTAPHGTFDAVLVALQTGTLLISDDLIVRQYFGAIAKRQGAWSQVVLQTAQARGLLEQDDYVRLTANLIDAGHAYIGTNGEALASAARIDHAAGDALGYNFRMHASTIGGPNAEMRSHFTACHECLLSLWSDEGTTPYRQPVTGYLLRQLIRGRPDDYGVALRAMLVATRGVPHLQEYLIGWLQGHFIPLTAIEAAGPASRPHGRKGKRKAK